MRDACGMEARYVGGMRCGFVDLMTFLFVHLVLLEPGWGSTRAGSLGIHIHPNTPSRCHAVISLFSSPPRARGVVDVRGGTDFSRFDPRPPGRPHSSNFDPPAEQRPGEGGGRGRSSLRRTDVKYFI